MADLRSVCVWCGSSRGARPEYLAAAGELGRLLAGQGMTLVFGGADVGLMGETANAAMAAGGRVVGVVPEAIAARVGHRGLSEIRVVGSMHDRKRMMFELSDAFIALPGGLGTLEELFEVLTWAQLGMHGKPCGLLNVAGYYDHLLRFLDHCVEQKFIKPAHRALLHMADDGRKLIDAFRAFVPPQIDKWYDGLPRGAAR